MSVFCERHLIMLFRAAEFFNLEKFFADTKEEAQDLFVRTFDGATNILELEPIANAYGLIMSAIVSTPESESRFMQYQDECLRADKATCPLCFVEMDTVIQAMKGVQVIAIHRGLLVPEEVKNGS